MGCEAMSKILVMYSGYTPTQRHLDALGKIAPDFAIVHVDSEEQAIAHASTTKIVLGHRYLRQIIPAARQLKWVQASAGGYDHLPTSALRSRSVQLTRTTFSSSVIAQHAVMLALALSRSLPESIRYQDNGLWGDDLYSALLPRPKRALVLGYGEIGKIIGDMLAAGGVEIIGFKKNAITADNLNARIYYDSGWMSEIENVDLIFICLPLTEETRNIVSKEVVSRLKNTAILVNVGRAECVDMAPVVERLQNGTLGGAGIDVFENRLPLPKNSPLWKVPRLIITPYLAARYGDRGLDLEVFCEAQLSRWVSGQKLQNRVF